MELDHRVATHNNVVAAVQEEALQASISNRSEMTLSSGFNDIAKTVEDVCTRTHLVPNAVKEEVSHAPLQYYTGLARRTTEMAVRETRDALLSLDNLAKPVRVMMAKSKMVAAIDVFTKTDEASAITDRPYLWKEMLERDKQHLNSRIDGLKMSVERPAELTPELEKVERAILTIVPSSFFEEMATIHERLHLPEISRNPSRGELDRLSTWRRAISTPEEHRLIAARAREGLSAIMRLGNDAAQSMRTKAPRELYWRGKVGAGFSGGLKTIDCILTIANMFSDALDRAAMNPQRRTVFDAAAAVVSDATGAGKIILDTTVQINFFYVQNQIPGDSYQQLQEAVADAYTAAAEAMDAYDQYNAADSEAAKVTGTIKMTALQHSQELPTQALQI